MPAAVPSANDPRLASNVLVLPLAGGVVGERTGEVKAFFDGTLRSLKRGDSPRFGEVLFVPERARLAVQVGSVLYDTGPDGMEAPPAGACGCDDDDDHQHGRGHAFGWHKGWRHGDDHPGGHDHRECPKRGWIILCNGPQGQSTPTPALDPRIAVGTPLGTLPGLPLVGSRPAWAQYGEGGLWYFRP
jgi:hypothetical protein